MTTLRQVVAKRSDLPEGGIKGVRVAGRLVLLANVGGAIYAVDGVCTHEDSDLSTGFLTEDRITCPLHLSQFSVKTGEALSPPATNPLKAFKVHVEGNDIILEF
jgi:3-phenylpropionate/trans-cinnamate dioxygenase ferredoxin subunit